jgi:type I restriction enzyme S subunit
MSFREWEEVRLEEIVEIIDSLHRTPTYTEKGLPMIRVTDLQEGYLKINNPLFVTDEVYNEFTKKHKPKYGDIILSRVGTCGIACLVKTNKKFCLGQNTLVLTNFKNYVDSTYVYYSLTSSFVKEQMEMLATGSTQKTISLKSLKSLKINIPPEKLQKAIAHILSTLDEKIEVNNQINKTLEKMAQAIFKQWFVDFEFPNEDGEPYRSSGGEMVESELGLVPKGWEVGSFTNFIDVLSGGTPKTKNKDYWDGEIPFFTPKDTNGTYCICTEKNLTEAGLNSCNSKLYDENTVFITARGTVGKLAMAGVKMAMNQSCYALVGKEDMNQFYVWFQIKSVVEKLQRGATGSVFDAIIVDTFKAIKIVKPNKSNIEKFRLIVEPVFQSIQSNYFEIEKLKNVRDALLPKLMAGEVRVSID